jgi:hypothetical protein
MKLNRYRFLFIPFTAIAVYSCGLCSTKKISCPGYITNVLDTLFPYRDNEVLRFKSSDGIIRTFTLQNTNITSPYEESGSFSGPPPSCFAEKSFRSNETDSSGTFGFGVNLFTNDEFKSATVYLPGAYVSLIDLSGNRFTRAELFIRSRSIPMTIQHLPAITLDNQTFGDVSVFSRDTTSNDVPHGIYVVYTAPNRGIIGYGVYPMNKIWVKQ